MHWLDTPGRPHLRPLRGANIGVADILSREERGWG
jgi:hypothetical protein